MFCMRTNRNEMKFPPLFTFSTKKRHFSLLMFFPFDFRCSNFVSVFSKKPTFSSEILQPHFSPSPFKLSLFKDLAKHFLFRLLTVSYLNSLFDRNILGQTIQVKNWKLKHKLNFPFRQTGVLVYNDKQNLTFTYSN
jgi:hypothetical protein